MKHRKFLILMFLLGALFSSSVIVSSKAFAVNINCNPIPSPCTGTDNADIMTLNQVSTDPYLISSKGGDDIVTAKPQAGKAVGIATGNGNDKISLKINDANSGAEGNSGDDIIHVTISSSGISDILHASIGLQGADKITLDVTGQVTPDSEFNLAQNGRPNTPDGKKDILNCGGAPNARAFLSIEDGDSAIHCQTVITDPT